MSANKDLQANYDTFILSYKKYYATTENYNVELFDMLQNKISLFIKKKNHFLWKFIPYSLG